METKYWKISRDCGFYTRVRVSLKRLNKRTYRSASFKKKKKV